MLGADTGSLGIVSDTVQVAFTQIVVTETSPHPPHPHPHEGRAGAAENLQVPSYAPGVSVSALGDLC